MSFCVEGEPLNESIELLGFARVSFTVTSDEPLALVVARLCDVAPDGASLLVTRGMLNLTQRTSRAAPEPLVPGTAERIGPTEFGPTMEVEELTAGYGSRRIERDLATGSAALTFDWDMGGRKRQVASRIEAEDTSTARYSIVEGAPLSARVVVENTSAVGRGDWQMSAHVRGEMTSDEQRSISSTSWSCARARTRSSHAPSARPLRAITCRRTPGGGPTRWRSPPPSRPGRT